jgi:Fur family ferric uptake transcriptional regulator
MFMQNEYDILRRCGLSITSCRKAILDVFLQSKEALSHAHIEKKTEPSFDRVTIYRTLQTFVEFGIIHQIPTTDNTVLYALCKDECLDGHHHDEHIHFICLSCKKTNCLEQVVIPKISLPKGFEPIQTAMVVKGFCNLCKN